MDSLQNSLMPFIGIDIGGTLAKICFSIEKNTLVSFKHLEHLKLTQAPQFDVYFNQFPTEKIELLIEFINALKLHKIADKLYVTGGGAYKFYDLFKEALSLEIEKVNEFESLSKGLEFIDLYQRNSAFFYSKKSSKIFVTQQKENYPFLLANVGSGVSFIKFSGPNQFERITGTCVGGGTFLGICHLLTGINDFEKLLEMANEGDDKKVDLFVKDIYTGTESPHLDLDSTSLAISLGRINSKKESELVRKEDVIKSLLHMIAFNIAQIAYLVAKLHNTQRVYFAGNFIRNHQDTMDSINFAFEFFSSRDENVKSPVFLSHDGFIGALGCLLTSHVELLKKKKNSI